MAVWPASAAEDLRTFIAYRVREGFASPDEILEQALAYAPERHGRDDLELEVRRIAAEELATQRAEQAGWTEPTDCDRLDAAFVALERQGIVARQHFSCCNNCGFTEIWEEVEKAEQHGPVEGYVFYHFQATERAIASGQLLLAYGAFDEDEAALARVANRIVAALRRAGLNASWGGTDRHPVVVEGLTWQRRR